MCFCPGEERRHFRGSVFICAGFGLGVVLERQVVLQLFARMIVLGVLDLKRMG